MSVKSYLENELEVLKSVQPDAPILQPNNLKVLFAAQKIMDAQGHSGFSYGILSGILKKLIGVTEPYGDYLKRELSEMINSGDRMSKMMASNAIRIAEILDGLEGARDEVLGQWLTATGFSPITPLTGDDSEWVDQDYGSGFTCRQNKRCPYVFMDEDGRPYNMRGKVFRTPSGACYTNKDSRVYFEFPYTPKTETVAVAEEAHGGGVRFSISALSRQFTEEGFAHFDFRGVLIATPNNMPLSAMW